MLSISLGVFQSFEICLLRGLYLGLYPIILSGLFLTINFSSFDWQSDEDFDVEPFIHILRIQGQILHEHSAL